MRRNYQNLLNAEDPILVLLECCATIRGDVCRGWFQHAGYNM